VPPFLEIGPKPFLGIGSLTAHRKIMKDIHLISIADKKSCYTEVLRDKTKTVAFDFL